MSDVDDLLLTALRQLEQKPPDTDSREGKQNFSQHVSERVAQVFAAELRNRGLRDTRPAPPGEVSVSGAEHRIAGGIGAKKVDVSCSTEESGLIAAISIKSINFADQKTKTFQKNMTNRRGDMLFEAVTLHRRFPYAVLAGFLFFDDGAARDGTDRRNSTFLNAHEAFKLFTGRADPAGREEQFERLYLVLHSAASDPPHATFYEAGKPEPISLKAIFDDLVELIAERNFDLYKTTNGKLSKR